MSRDTNQNLYAEQIITESPFYYDEYGRLRARVLQEEVANLKAAEDEEKKDVSVSVKRVAAPDTTPAAEGRPVKGGPAKPNPGMRPIAAAPPKETVEPTDIVKSPNLRDSDQSLPPLSTMPTENKIKPRPAVGIGRIGRGRVTDMRYRLPGRGRITGINRRPIGGEVRRGGGTNVNVRPTRPGSSGNMYAEGVEQSEE